MPSREEVYNAIDTERAYQERAYPEAPTIGQALEQIEKFHERAWGTNEKRLDNIRKIAGIAVRAMENHGAPHRID
jgi:aminoglycoside N3'-acetyltransferase